MTAVATEGTGTAGAQQDTEEGTEISVGQDEESEMGKQRTECGIEPLQGEYFIARLQFSSSTKHARKDPAFRPSEYPHMLY